MSFDPVAPHYRWMERVFAGERLQRARVALLAAIPPPHNTLVYGEGNGRFLAAFRQRFPSTHVTVVDASAAMLARARVRLRRAGMEEAGIQWVQADALQWAPSAAAFDLIVTCFFLDCFDAAQLRGLVPRIAAAATPGARWLVADFQTAAAGWRRLRSQAVVALLYAFFRRAAGVEARELADPAPLLQAEGFQRALFQEQDHGLLHSSLWVRQGCPSRS